MECEGYDAMRQIIRHRVAARGIWGFGPAERFFAAAPGRRDQPRPPMSPTGVFEAIEGVVNPNGWIHSLIAESAPKFHHHKLSLFYLALIPRAHDHFVRVGREPAAATPLERLIEAWAV